LPAAEGFGYGFAEAMLQGLPSIYINFGGHTAYLNEKFGYPIKTLNTSLISKNTSIKWKLADTDDAAKQMLYVVNNYVEVKTKGENARNFAIANFDWNLIGQKFAEHFNTCFSDTSTTFSFLLKSHK
jgi:glycosyltransferase involved in cell wall biosynthesis